ncbi:MAG: hypothetical protein HOL17_05585 [Gammaproteobacteria bacterium]|jgi:hypothetical protein|nr:hypothetical protein [Candidatus Neomarinimicrobiota bacterium]MBT5371177.1 hypothetical protein [Gammaproteobacteria bacterium]
MAYPMIGGPSGSKHSRSTDTTTDEDRKPQMVVEGEVITASDWNENEAKAQQASTPTYAAHEYLVAGHSKLEVIVNVFKAIRIYKDQYGRACFQIMDNDYNAQVYLVDSENGHHVLFRYLLELRFIPTTDQINFLFNRMESYSAHFGENIHSFYRVAPCEGGVEIDLGSSDLSHVKITAEGWSIVYRGSGTKFLRFKNMQALPLPAEGKGSIDDLNLLKKYFNTDWTSFILVIAWIVYIMLTPKIHSSNFVILALNAVAGSGKSLFTKILLLLIDPTAVGIRTFPQNKKAVGIAAKSSHVVAYDNMRRLSKFISDLLCQLATGGVLTDRKLYTDDGETLINVHVALILNGIHHYIEEPDLADRCLPINLEAINSTDRIPESELLNQFHNDRPVILRGIYQLASDVLKALPSVNPTHPVRMVEFSRTLAAVEAAKGIPVGTLQEEYARRLQDIKRDAVLSDPVMEAMVEFANRLPYDSEFSLRSDATEWTGTPTELLVALGDLNGKRYRYNKQFPDSAISLSKRLRVLEKDLLKEGIEVLFKRSKVRLITIRINT